MLHFLYATWSLCVQSYQYCSQDGCNVKCTCLYLMPSVLWCCWLGGRKGICLQKTWLVGIGMVICLEQDADLHMAQLMPLPLTVSCFSKMEIGLPFWYRLTRKRAVKRVCVCVCIWYYCREDWKPVLTINSIVYGLQYLFLVSFLMF